MRALKTKFPCTGCGDPAEVVSLREAEHALCSRCRERNRLISVANLHDRDAMDLMARIPDDKAAESERLAAYLRAAEDRLSAARYYAESVQVALPNERDLLLRAAKQRFEWSKEVLAQLAPVVESARDEERSKTGLFTVIDGAAEPPVRVEVARPALRLVKRDDLEPRA